MAKWSSHCWRNSISLPAEKLPARLRSRGLGAHFPLARGLQPILHLTDSGEVLIEPRFAVTVPQTPFEAVKPVGYTEGGSDHGARLR